MCSLGFIGCSTDSALEFLGTSSGTSAQKWDFASPLPEALRAAAGAVDSQVNLTAQIAAFQPHQSSELIVHPSGTASRSDKPHTWAVALCPTAISLFIS